MSDQDNHETPIDPTDSPDNGAAEVGVGMTMEEYENLQAELESAKADAAKNLVGWQRAQADYSNLQRRTAQEREQMRGELLGKIIAPFLDVLDDLDLAVQNRPEGAEDNGWGDGIELVYRKLLSKLESQGVQMMDAEGKEFDPNLHEAITQEDNDEIESGHIIAVVKPGYMIGERVIRPAMVRVAA